MRLFLTAILSLTAVLSAIPIAAAHSPGELEEMLGSREKYFQAVDKPAPDFALRSADGRDFTLDDFRGKVVVLHFVYTHCPDVCPLHAERIAEIQAMVNETPMKDRVVFLTITTDPSRDTPDVMQAFGKAHGLDPANWLFLTTRAGQPEDTTRNLARQFGHKFMKTDDGLQLHGTVTHVIDKEGRWRANFHGLNFQPVNMVMFLNSLSNEFDNPGAAEAAE